MLGPWESLKVNAARGLLAAISAPSLTGEGVGFFAVYDIKADCRKPRLLSSVSTTDLGVPANVLGHEGNWSPDGKTYWGTGYAAGVITAIDVSDPRRPLCGRPPVPRPRIPPPPTEARAYTPLRTSGRAP